ncbi:uncharacterized protein PRCAT00003188001 [Priceomyces carsonii]|uniref:uncharacterized protein n=1 Tax=Priceomyces carsonii TaxID=28549 RepID=UPI002ED8CA94|nr:unnamed protein product [Priceomyces carsonii]
MYFSPLLSLLLTITSFVNFLSALDISAKNNVAVYWGQNAGLNQERLSEYCDTSSANIVILSFISSFPSLTLNFANQCSDTFSDGLLHCSDIGSDIKSCQAKGIKVLLSMGGASGTYGFDSDSEAETFATTLWNKFAGGSDDERPFDDAVVDGFDFDIENNQQTGYTALADKLRDYFDGDSSKTYYLSAAPQCPYPDQSVGDLMANSKLDFAFIQFYNNYCALGSSFNYDTWADYAKSAPNSNIKLFVGLPASSLSAGSGYNDASTVADYVDKFQNDAHFGGFSLWDASSAWANTNGNQNYAQQLKELITSNVSEAATTAAISEVDTSISTNSVYSVTGSVTSSASDNSFSPTFTTSQNVETYYVDSTVTVIVTATPSSQVNQVVEKRNYEGAAASVPISITAVIISVLMLAM